MGLLGLERVGLGLGRVGPSLDRVGITALGVTGLSVVEGVAKSMFVLVDTSLLGPP